MNDQGGNMNREDTPATRIIAADVPREILTTVLNGAVAGVAAQPEPCDRDGNPHKRDPNVIAARALAVADAALTQLVAGVNALRNAP